MFSGHFPHHLHLFQTLMPFFGRWGYMIIFIGAFLEALPLIGYLAPGGISVIVGGFLARNGVLNLSQVLIFAFIGAFLGDLLAFSIGKIYGYHFLRNYGRYFFLKEKHIEKTEKLLKNHTGKALIVGRFSYLTRSLSSFLAGASDIRAVKFFSFSLISVLVWDVGHVLIGFVAGQGYAVAARFVNYIFLGAIVLSIVIFYGYRLINRRHHVFKKYHVYTLVFNILSIYIFAEALRDILDRGWLFHVDRAVNHFIPTIWNPIVIQIMIVVTNLLTPLNVFLFSCLFIGYLLHQSEWYYSLLSFLALIIGVLSEYVLKLIIGVPRPIEPLLTVSNFSFPSGHATLISIFGLLLFHCLRRNFKNNGQKTALFIGCLGLILLVGASRIYLNAHWLSDVIGGYALGVFSVTFCILFLRAVSYIWPKVRAIAEVLIWPIYGKDI